MESGEARGQARAVGGRAPGVWPGAGAAAVARGREEGAVGVVLVDLGENIRFYLVEYNTWINYLTFQINYALATG